MNTILPLLILLFLVVAILYLVGKGFSWIDALTIAFFVAFLIWYITRGPGSDELLSALLAPF